METITNYGDLIRLIPAKNQSAVIKKRTWERFSYDSIKSIFGDNEIVEISRENIRSETNTAKKIVMTLMWGYPTGGRGNNIKNVLEKIDKLSELLEPINGQNLTETYASEIMADFDNIPGLGISTWTKFLYFFKVSIDSKECQIFDQKIVDSLNKRQFTQLGEQEWKQNINQYFKYIELVNSLASDLKASPEQVELFLFYYNLDYKFRA